MDHENTYASKGVGNTALGLSIGALAGEVLGGGIGNLFGGNNGGYVSRNESALLAENAELKADKKLLESNIYTDAKMLEVYRYIDGKIGCIEAQINQQAVYNATNNATVSCLSNQVAQLLALTKTVVPIDNVCPAPMPQYNSWTAPTTA